MVHRIDEFEDQGENERRGANPEVEPYRKEVARLSKLLQRRLSGEEAILQAVREVFEDNPVVLKAPDPPVLDGSKRLKEIAVLHFSDGQIGKVTASYNSGVAEERVQRAVRKVQEITEIRRRTAAIPKIKVLLGGDEIEGESIFPGQAFQIDSGTFDQAVRNGPAIYSKAILTLLETFEVVEVHEVPGNHGRAAARSVGSHPRTNWDNVCHEIVRLMLSSVPPGRIKWFPNTHWFTIFETFGHKHLMVHGDQIRGGFAGFPWYGVGRKALSWGESIPEWDSRPRYLWHGHFHQCTSWPIGTTRIFGNGTLESDNEYARAEFGLMGHPEQRLAFFGDRGLLADCPLYLGEG